MLRWHLTPGAMALGVLGGVNRLGGGVSSRQCSFQWGASVPRVEIQ